MYLGGNTIFVVVSQLDIVIDINLIVDVGMNVVVSYFCLSFM